MNKKKVPEDQLQSEFNMSVADMIRMDETLKLINRCILHSSKFKWKMYLTEIYAGLRIIYETMRPVANQSKREAYDERFEDVRKDLYIMGRFDRETFDKLLLLYRDLMTLRQMLGFGVRVSSQSDWTDEFAVD